MGAATPQTVRRVHLFTDMILVGVGWLGAYGLRHALDGVLGREVQSFSTYVEALPLIVPSWVLSCWLFGIYHTHRFESVVDQVQKLLRGTLMGLLVVSSVGFYFKEFEFARLVILFSAGLNLLLQGLSRAVFYRLERRLRRSGHHDVPALILGAGIMGVRLLQKVQDHPEVGYRVVGFLDDAPALRGDSVADRPVLGRIEDLRKIVAEHGVSDVFVAMPSLGHTRLLSLVIECEDLTVNFRMVTPLFDVLNTETPVDLLDDLPLVRLGGRRPHTLYEPTKRVLDVLLASAALILTLPFCGWWAWRIKRDSPGPVLFSQMRVGRDGRLFRMIKLRTMSTSTEPYAEAPHQREDPRITRYGAWLRKTSIDELPQLWNVLRGEMSLVGPRPEMPFIVSRYQEWQRRRLTVKPGITGLWQILGRKDLPMQENIQYDFYYIKNRSLLMDVSIILRTGLTVLMRKGAF